MIVTCDPATLSSELTEREREILSKPLPLKAKYSVDSPELTEQRAKMLGDAIKRRSKIV